MSEVSPSQPPDVADLDLALNAVPHRRWYDEVNGMKAAVHLSKDLPEAIQHLIAKNLNQYIDMHRSRAKNGSQAVSVGANRALGLYKASKKLRWYDQHSPQLHRAFNLMSVIPDQFLSRYAHRMIDVSRYVAHRKKTDFYYNPWDIASTVDNLLSQSLETAPTQGISLTETGGSIRLTQPNSALPVKPGEANNPPIVIDQR